MERTSARCLLLFVTSAFPITVTVAPVSARVNPAKPPLGTGPSGAPALDPTFECGTYKGNESETPWLRDMHNAQQRLAGFICCDANTLDARIQDS